MTTEDFCSVKKPLFSNKVRSIVYCQFIKNEYKIVNILNNFFINVVLNLGIKFDQQ